jgi:hypothetical protein
LKGAGTAYRSRLRNARRTAQSLRRLLGRKTEEQATQQQVLYQRLITITQQIVQQATRVVVALRTQIGQQAQRLVAFAQHMLPLVERVIAQTQAPVLEGKKVAYGSVLGPAKQPHIMFARESRMVR